MSHHKPRWTLAQSPGLCQRLRPCAHTAHACTLVSKESRMTATSHEPHAFMRGLVSSLDRNSKRRPFRFGFTDRHIGRLDKVPVLSHRGPEDLRERSVAHGDQEHFTQAWTSCLEPGHSVVKEHVGKPSLSGEPECLSLHLPLLSESSESGKERRHSSHG